MNDVVEVARWAEGIKRVHECIAGRFRRPEPRRRALEYLRGLLSPVERKNGWQLAEQAGDATPDGVQRLLSTYRWDADQVRDDLRDYVVEHLGDADGVLVVDETGFLKKGDKSVGVQRQYSGTAGRIENSQVGVFLAYAGVKGRTLLDRELYLPQVWAEDRERRREAGVPEYVGFRTKPQLAQMMLERAVESGIPFGWVTGDEVYGSDRNLRLWLERKGVPHVLAIKRSEKLWAWTDKGPRQVRADRLALGVEESGWQRLSAGDGAKGPRVYDWTTVAIRPLREPGKGHWLLARRSIAKPDELAYYVCYGPAGTTQEELAEGRRDPLGYRGMLRGGQGTGGTGPVRGTQMGWLVSPHHPGDVGSRLPGGDQVLCEDTGMPGGKGGRPSRDRSLIPLTVPEVRRLLTRLIWTQNRSADFVLSWSHWRRRHQARAQQSHYQRRLSQLTTVVRL